MSKYFVKNISNILRGKYTRNLLHHAKQSATDEFKTDSKRVIQKKAEATGDLIGNKITNRIIKVSKRSPHDSLETVKMRMIKKYLQKDTYLQKKDIKLLMI